MATTIVNPPASTSDNGMGFLIGIVILIAFVVVLLVYGLPLIQRSLSNATPQINVPDHVNVNVEQKK